MNARCAVLGFSFSLIISSSLFAMDLPRTDALTRTTVSFDADWRFLKSDATGAEQPGFADSSWRALDVPHDWSIEGPFDEQNPTTGAGGFLPSGVSWYRKHFRLPANSVGRRVFIDFDGVMQNSDVWINGAHLVHRPFGYVSFRCELTAHLRADADNVISVRTDTAAQPASRWYSGAGIYRHVRLIVTDAVHFDTWATFVSTPTITGDSAVVRVQSKVINQSAAARPVSLQVTLLAPDGQIIATVESPMAASTPGATLDLSQELTLQNPALWQLDHPALHRAVVRLRSAGEILDEETVTFGIRDAHFEAATGFWLNGKNFKIKGVCLHHDGGAFGAAVPLSIWEQRLTTLQSLGVNAIRTAHNPVAPEFLDLCDRLGLLVMDELFDCWTVEKNPHDYHLYFRDWSERDARDTVRRDRNHPSIILYSAGNEIHDTPKAMLAHDILAGLVATFHAEDPTRPVTQALFRPNVSKDFDNGLADLLDVIGVNYRDTELLAAHKAKPTRKILGSEQAHDRRVWLHARDHAEHAGQFLWTGIDYLGESRKWPNVGAGSGLLDKAGGIKPMAYERASRWLAQPVVHMVRRVGAWQFAPADPGFTPLDRKQVLFRDWSPTAAAPHEETLEIYSNCEAVELFLNGVSLGSKPLPADASPRVWQVAYAPGQIKAVASNGGEIVATDDLRSSGPATKIQLTATHTQLTPAWNDVVKVTATVVDAQGVRVAAAAPAITFDASGPGNIIATDNADLANHESFQAMSHHAYQGECVAFARATATNGIIRLSATSPDLESGTIELKAAPVAKE